MKKIFLEIIKRTHNIQKIMQTNGSSGKCVRKRAGFFRGLKEGKGYVLA